MIGLDKRKVWSKILGKEWVIPSFDMIKRAEGIKYTVTKDGRGYYTCTCPAFKFKSGVVTIKSLDGKRIEACKHIIRVLQNEALLSRI